MAIIKNIIEFEDEMYSEIIEKIRSLIDKMLQEKFIYDVFIKLKIIIMVKSKNGKISKYIS